MLMMLELIRNILCSIAALFVPSRSCFDTFSKIIVPITVMLLNVWIVNRHTKRQFKNQNKHTYKPILKIFSIKVIDMDHSKPRLAIHSEKVNPNNTDIEPIMVKIDLKNIGRGTAENIYFHNFTSGKYLPKVNTKYKEDGQRGNIREELGVDNTENYYFEVYVDKYNIKDITKDFIVLICSYTDYMGNINNFYIRVEFSKQDGKWVTYYKDYNEGNYYFKNNIETDYYKEEKYGKSRYDMYMEVLRTQKQHNKRIKLFLKRIKNNICDYIIKCFTHLKNK